MFHLPELETPSTDILCCELFEPNSSSVHGACAASSEKHYSAEWEPPLCLFVLSRKSSETVSLILSRLTYGFHQNVLRAAIKSKTCTEVVFWWWLAVVLKSRSSGKDRVASPTTAPISKLQKINYTPVLSCSIKLHHTGKHHECVWSTANTHTGAALLIRRGCCGLKAHQKCLLLNLPFFLKLFLSPCDLPTSWKSNARILGSPMLSFLFSPDKAWTRLATLSGFCEVHWKRCTRERSKQIEPYIPNYQEFSQFCRAACHICREGEWALCALLWFTGALLMLPSIVAFWVRLLVSAQFCAVWRRAAKCICSAPSLSSLWCWTPLMMGWSNLTPEQSTVGHEQSCSEPAGGPSWGSSYAGENDKKES